MGASGHCVEVLGYRVINGYRSIGVGYLGRGGGAPAYRGIGVGYQGIGVRCWCIGVGIGVSTLQVLQPRSGGGTLCISEAETLGTPGNPGTPRDRGPPFGQ